MFNTKELLSTVRATSSESTQHTKTKVSASAALTQETTQTITGNDIQTIDCHYNYNTSSEILAGLKEKYYDAPDSLLEWVASDLGASAIAPKIVLNNFAPVWDKKAIAQFLGWKAYMGELGWIACGQFKPMQPVVFPDGSSAKYLTGKTYDAALLKGVDWDTIADDSTEPIIITEGAKKAASLITQGKTAISVPGVDMGHKPDKRGVELVPNLDRFAVPGRPIILVFDSDITEKSEVQSALINLGATLKKKGCVVTVWTWDSSAGKGIDDAIANGKFNQVKEITYKEFVQKLEKQFPPTDTKKKKYDTDWADEIAEINRDVLAWDDTIREWRKYEQGVWSIISETQIVQIIKTYIQSQGKGCRMGQISSIEKLMRANLFRKEWDENPDLIPFKDGVFDLKTNKLLPHSPVYNLTWQLPRGYHSESDSWEKIGNWLTFAVERNQTAKNILIAFSAATIRGRADLHKFLHIQGVAGSGKSSFIRLLEDLVGENNHYSSSLTEWNNTRFESANGHGKRLVSFPDENSKIKNIEGFKKLTGQDLIRYEEKGKKATNYRFNGMVVIASNSSPFVGGSTSAIARRKLEVFFNAVVPSSQRRDLNAEFQDELPAFTRYLLSLDNEWITQVLRGQQGLGMLTADIWDNQCQNNSIAAWLDEWVIFDSDVTAPIGNQKASQDDKQNDCFTLYQSYTLFCCQNNYQPKSIRRFSADLLELGTVLNQPLEKAHTKTGKVIKGLRLRSKLDVNIPTYTEILESQNHPQNDPVTDVVTDGDGLVTDVVTDETLTVTDGDGCDGFLGTFSKKSFSESVSHPTEQPTNDTQIASTQTADERKSQIQKSTDIIKKLMRMGVSKQHIHSHLVSQHNVQNRSELTMEQLDRYIADLERLLSEAQISEVPVSVLIKPGMMVDVISGEHARQNGRVINEPRKLSLKNKWNQYDPPVPCVTIDTYLHKFIVRCSDIKPVVVT